MHHVGAEEVVHEPRSVGGLANPFVLSGLPAWHPDVAARGGLIYPMGRFFDNKVQDGLPGDDETFFLLQERVHANPVA